MFLCRRDDLERNREISIFKVIFISVFMVLFFEVILLSQNLIISLLNSISLLRSQASKLIFSIIYQIFSYLFIFLIFNYYILKSKVEKYKIKGAFFFYIALIILAYLLSAATLSFFSYIKYIPPSAAERAFEELMAKFPWYGAISALLVAPICEEVFFRYYVLNYLEKAMKPVSSIIVSALLFGAFHLNIRQFLFASVLGIVLGIVYRKSRDIKHCIFLHFFFNVVSFLNIVLLMEPAIIIPLCLMAIYLVSSMDLREDS